MAESLFNKARVAVLGRLHALLDNAANTPEAFKQRIRDLETSLAELRAANDEQVGSANGYARDITKAESDKASKQSDIDLLLGDDDPTNDSSALDLQIQLEDLDKQIQFNTGLKTQAEANSAQLSTAISQLENKHREMVNGLNQLTLTAAATKAQNRAASAAEAALSASSVDGTNIDSIQQKLDHEKDVSDARFARVIGGMEQSTTPEEAAKLARAKAALLVRREQIHAQATTKGA
jgi:phage shock protein A